MTASSTRELVISSERFVDALRSIRSQSMVREFPSISTETTSPEPDWNFALFCASALTSDAAEEAQELVLRVASGCLESDRTNPAQKAAAAALLERLGNRRTVGLAENRNLLEHESWRTLPISMRLEVIRSRIELSIPRDSDDDLSVNIFQNEFWKAANTSAWVSVSAPTSAGKSRIIREWIAQRVQRSLTFTAVYVVPTRALVEEVARDFRENIPSTVGIFTLPWDSSLADFTQKVFVVTQERLHLLQSGIDPFFADMLFVDEAQNLGDGARGVLLQRVIDTAVGSNPFVQVLFASPMSSNPELLLTDAPRGLVTRAFKSEAVTVSQNLIHVRSTAKNLLSRDIYLLESGLPRYVGSLTLANRASHVPKKLAFVAHALGGMRGGNIVYVKGPSEAENVSKALFESSADVTNPEHAEELRNLIELVRSAVHPKYALADCLRRGVAFHYGNMPLAIRVEIERLFETGAIKYLVCTSTLLEGVNLSCRNLFMRNPQKGVNKPLSTSDFWNLAGRAGRWGREFQGNVVCVDTDDPTIWPNLPVKRVRAPLSRAVHKSLNANDELIDFIRSSRPSGTEDSRAESVFSYLTARSAEGADLMGLLVQIDDPSKRAVLLGEITAVAGAVSYPVGLISRHSGISPLAMQRLLDYFRKSVDEPAELALPFPDDSNARARYHHAFEILSETVTTAFGQEKRQWQLANLVVNWMNGSPLSRLIEQRLSTSSKPLSTVIRDVMGDVETVARFHAPKYLACYLDLLRFHAEEIGKEGDLPVVDVTMMLELGVSRITEVSLMAVGLSRTATIAISAFINDEELSPAEVLRWLRLQNIEGLNLPMLVQREIMNRLLINTSDQVSG